MLGELRVCILQKWALEAFILYPEFANTNIFSNVSTQPLHGPPRREALAHQPGAEPAVRHSQVPQQCLTLLHNQLGKSQNRRL